jgi:hypothetical protein
MHEILTVGSVVLAIVNVGVMWAMAHQWRYAWHCNLALQLLWLPYDYVTSQVGLLGLGIIITFVSLKGAFRENQLAKAAERSQPSHRRQRQRGGSRPAASPAPATTPPPAVPSTPAPGPRVAAEAGGGVAVLAGPEAAAQVAPEAAVLTGPEVHPSAGTGPGVVVHVGVTVPADAAGLADGTDLAGVSVSAAPAISADRDADDPKQPPAAPLIPQQVDRRTAMDGERRPHFH